MGEQANVLAINALAELKGVLSHFSGDAQETLQAVEHEIRRILDWLQERLNYWQNQVRQRQVEVAQATAALARCLASGYRDERGNYHAPDCSRYQMALHQAQMRLREAEAELHNVQQWTRVVGQAIADYQRQAQRLNQMLATDLLKAEAFLGRKFADLVQYQANVPISAPGIGVTAPSPPSPPTSGTLSGVSWAEKQAILKQIDDGLPITPEDLWKLEQPISDIQAGSVEEATNWVEQLLEAERYREAMRDSQEAQNLKEAILTTLKALNYWRSKS
ncbi:MAG: hypothetical protein AB1649_18730 [Chloroflexota bacterium]